MRRLLLALSLLLVGFVPPQDSSPTYEVPSAPVLSIWSEEPSVSTYVDNIADRPLDQNPIGNGWTVLSGTHNTSIIEESNSPLGDGRAWKLGQSSTDGERVFTRFDAIETAVEDTEVLLLGKYGNSTINTIKAIVRGDSTFTNNYRGGFRGRSVSKEISIRRTASLTADPTVLAEAAFASEAATNINVWLWWRFRAEGTVLSAKVWRYIDPEPAEWNISVENSDLTSGLVGFYRRCSNATERFWHISYYSVGTGGTAAPMPLSFLPIFNSKVQNTLLRR